MMFDPFGRQQEPCMPRILKPMPGRVRILVCCGLAFLNASMSAGNPTGFVLCIEDDGSVAIESPAAQAACQQRHESAAALAATHAGIRIAGAGNCVDVPLSLAPGAVLHRAGSACWTRGEHSESRSLWISEALFGMDSSSHGPQPSVDGSPPASTALAVLRTIVLLI
jgi:hypothetical protein